MGVAAALLAFGFEPASAKGGRDAEHDGRHGAKGKPMLAIVSLSDQRISIYGAEGKLLDAPVSTGSRGYETPAGIFSIVQKKEHHQSNLYEDGEMPFMQRITWTGIALHAGALPGRPASHGCIRLPMAFARRLFDMTELGMRVVIVRDGMRPSDIAHPALFKSKPVSSELERELRPATQRSARLGAPVWDGDIAAGSARHLSILRAIASAKGAELEAATSQQGKARAAASRAASQAAAAARSLRAAEAALARAEGALRKAEDRLGKATSERAREQAEKAKAQALARVGELQGKLETVKAQERPKREAAERANEVAKAALAAKDRAAQAAEEAARSTLPVSVLISRRTQRLYVRRGTHPVFEGPVTIRDVEKPIGTFVFTALGPLETSGEMRWNVVSTYKDPTDVEPASQKEQPRKRGKVRTAAAATDAAAAGAALDRIAISQEALDYIQADVVLPGSSLIVSDEGPSRETGKDTDFVVVMSGEPQGALKIRKPESRREAPFAGSPWGGGSPFFWKW